MNNDILHNAFEYADQKISFLPLNGKRPSPILKGWEDLMRRHPTYGEIHAWFGFWAQRQYRPNIGLIMGKISGLVALDADSEQTDEWIRKNLPHTEMQTITGKGRHHIYQLPQGLEVRPRVRIKGMQLDVRGEASYVVGHPSVHPETGKRYEKAGSWNLSEVPFFEPEWIEEELPVIPLPTWITEPRQKIGNGEKYIMKIFAVSGSGGHNQTFRAACKLRDSGYSLAEALETLKRWNLTNAKPAWSDSELEHKILSAFAKDGKRA